MSNPIKYSVTSEPLSLKKGDFYIGTGDVGKGPTSSTGFYAGITPPVGGYSVYLNKATGGPSIFCPTTDSQLITITNGIAGANYTTVDESLNYFAGQNDKMVINKNYGPIITSGLVLNYDANFIPSYPRTGPTIYTMNGTPNGVLTGGAFFNTDKIVLDGVDGFINLGTTPAINFSNGLTIEIEINFAELSPSGGEKFLDLNDSSGTLISFGRDSTSSNVKFTCRDITGPDVTLQRSYQSTGNPLQINKIATYSVTLPAGTPGDVTTGCKLYENGVEIGGTLTNPGESPRLPSTQTRNVGYIGKSSSAGNAFLNGFFYKFRMYNRELSAAEILQNYNASEYSISVQGNNWRDRIIANGGSIEPGILKIIDVNLITPMVTSGIFDCLDRLNLYAGTGNRIAARTNIINNNYYVQENNVNNLDWIDQFGYFSAVPGSTGGYLTMGYNPSTAPKWSADRFNCSQFVYTRFFNNLNFANLMGNGFATASRSATLVRTLSSGVSRLAVFMNQSAATAISNPLEIATSQRYWLCGTRSGNIVNNIVNTETLSYTLAPLSTILNQEIAELCLLGQTGGPNNMDLNSHQASGHGNNNYDNQLLRSYIVNTLTALNS